MVFVSCTKQELPKEIVKSVGGGNKHESSLLG